MCDQISNIIDVDDFYILLIWRFLFVGDDAFHTHIYTFLSSLLSLWDGSYFTSEADFSEYDQVFTQRFVFEVARDSKAYSEINLWFICLYSTDNIYMYIVLSQIKLGTFL